MGFSHCPIYHAMQNKNFMWNSLISKCFQLKISLKCSSSYTKQACRPDVTSEYWFPLPGPIFCQSLRETFKKGLNSAVKKSVVSWMWWGTPFVLALGNQKQEELCEFQASQPISTGGEKRTGWPYREGRYLHMVLHEITSSIANTMRKREMNATYRRYEIKPQEDFWY